MYTIICMKSDQRLWHRRKLYDNYTVACMPDGQWIGILDADAKCVTGRLSLNMITTLYLLLICLVEAPETTATIIKLTTPTTTAKILATTLVNKSITKELPNFSPNTKSEYFHLKT